LVAASYFVKRELNPKRRFFDPASRSAIGQLVFGREPWAPILHIQRTHRLCTKISGSRAKTRVLETTAVAKHGKSLSVKRCPVVGRLAPFIFADWHAFLQTGKRLVTDAEGQAGYPFG
jgi:hypothetical protein